MMVRQPVPFSVRAVLSFSKTVMSRLNIVEEIRTIVDAFYSQIARSITAPCLHLPNVPQKRNLLILKMHYFKIYCCKFS